MYGEGEKMPHPIWVLLPSKTRDGGAMMIADEQGDG